MGHILGYKTNGPHKPNIKLLKSYKVLPVIIVNLRNQQEDNKEIFIHLGIYQCISK